MSGRLRPGIYNPLRLVTRQLSYVEGNALILTALEDTARTSADVIMRRGEAAREVFCRLGGDTAEELIALERERGLLWPNPYWKRSTASNGYRRRCHRKCQTGCTIARDATATGSCLNFGSKHPSACAATIAAGPTRLKAGTKTRTPPYGRGNRNATRSNES